MKNETGPYSLLNKRVKEIEKNGAACIDRSDLATFLDLSEMDRKQLEKQCANAMAANILWVNGYRSFVKGEGLYIHPKKFKDARYVQQLVNNAVIDRDKRNLVIKSLEKIADECISNYSDSCKDQRMEFDENGNFVGLVEELDIQEALSVLKLISKAII